MIALACAFLLSFAVSLAIENGRPAATSFRAPGPAILLRLAVHGVLFAAAFALSWRPWHAGFVAVAVSGLFGAGSAMKLRILGEPLVFTDFALVRLAIRHPRLYYADRLARPPALAGFATLIAATAGWFWIEPPILPAWPAALGPPLLAAGLAIALRSPPASRFAERLARRPPDAAADAARLGLGASMAVGWLCWRRQARPSAAATDAALAVPALRPARDGPAIVVAIQCESFVDIAARGIAGPALPGYRALAQRGLAWGRCAAPAAEGAYTMRSEFAFLTGLPADALGFDAFDPFLEAEAYAEWAMARRYAASGRRTRLVHPYDRRFFERDRLAPVLGFERFLDGAAFDGAARFGPYVSDAALADRLVAEIAAAREPTFIFAVSIENHGPWGPGRIAGVDDPAAQYALHLANADRMIRRVARALAGVPNGGVLCAYGDHAPSRALHPDLPARRDADYLLWDSRDCTRKRTPRRDLTIDALGRLLLARS